MYLSISRRVLQFIELKTTPITSALGRLEASHFLQKLLSPVCSRALRLPICARAITNALLATTGVFIRGLIRLSRSSCSSSFRSYTLSAYLSNLRRISLLLPSLFKQSNTLHVCL